MKGVKPFGKRMKLTEEGNMLFIGASADTVRLMKFCNELAEKIDELVMENGILRIEMEILRAENRMNREDKR